MNIDKARHIVKTFEKADKRCKLTAKESKSHQATLDDLSNRVIALQDRQVSVRALQSEAESKYLESTVDRSFVIGDYGEAKDRISKNSSLTRKITELEKNLHILKEWEKGKTKKVGV